MCPPQEAGQRGPKQISQKLYFSNENSLQMWKVFLTVLLMGPGELQTRGWSGLFTQMGRIGCKVCCRSKGRRMGGSLFIHSFVHSLSQQIFCYCSFSTRFSAGCRGNGSVKKPLASRNTDLETKTDNQSLPINATDTYGVPRTEETAGKKSDKVSPSWSL